MENKESSGDFSKKKRTKASRNGSMIKYADMIMLQL
jgi:hypothetical protein